MIHRGKQRVSTVWCWLCVWTYQTLLASVCLLVVGLIQQTLQLQCSLCVLTLECMDTFNKAQCIVYGIAPTRPLIAEFTWRHSFAYVGTIFPHVQWFSAPCIVQHMWQLSVLCTSGIKSPTEIAEESKRGREPKKTRFNNSMKINYNNENIQILKNHCLKSGNLLIREACKTNFR